MKSFAWLALISVMSCDGNGGGGPDGSNGNGDASGDASGDANGDDGGCLVRIDGKCGADFAFATRTQAEICQLYDSEWPTSASTVFIPGGSECDPGMTTDEARADALRRTNFYRNLAGLTPVEEDVALNSTTQQCALVQARRGELSHKLTPADPCYTKKAASGAASSNIASGIDSPAVSVDLYVSDNGVPTLGHRRWTLHPDFATTSFGYVDTFSCMSVFGHEDRPDPQFVSWPPPGISPTEVTGGDWSISAASLSGGRFIIRDSAGTILTENDQPSPEGYGLSTLAGDSPTNFPVPGSYEITVESVDLGNGPVDVTIAIRLVSCNM